MASKNSKSLQETAYLLRSPRNSKRLNESIKEIEDAIALQKQKKIR